MKTRRVVDLVRGLPANEALNVLRFAPQAASEPVDKVLASAIANAEHNATASTAPTNLVVTEAYVDEGPTAQAVPAARPGPCVPHPQAHAATSPSWSSPRRARGSSGCRPPAEGRAR